MTKRKRRRLLLCSPPLFFLPLVRPFPYRGDKSPSPPSWLSQPSAKSPCQLILFLPPLPLPLFRARCLYLQPPPLKTTLLPLSLEIERPPGRNCAIGKALSLLIIFFSLSISFRLRFIICAMRISGRSRYVETIGSRCGRQPTSGGWMVRGA